MRRALLLLLLALKQQPDSVERRADIRLPCIPTEPMPVVGWPRTPGDSAHLRQSLPMPVLRPDTSAHFAMPVFIARACYQQRIDASARDSTPSRRR